VYAANLSSGNYIYYLLINGEVKETKQMNCVK